MSGKPKPEVWVDAQLPPALAGWLQESYNLKALSLREWELRDAENHAIFHEANKRGATLISKDSDFVDLVQRFGRPLQFTGVTCGNVTNANLKVISSAIFGRAMDSLAAGEAIVEIGQRKHGVPMQEKGISQLVSVDLQAVERFREAS